MALLDYFNIGHQFFGPLNGSGTYQENRCTHGESQGDIHSPDHTEYRKINIR